MKLDAVIFDVDGTLWDPADLVAEAWNGAAAEFNIPQEKPITGTELKSLFGKPMDVFMNGVFPGLSEELQEKVYDFTANLEDEILAKNTKDLLYPGVREMLEELAKVQKIYIVSNCQCGYIETFMRTHNLEQYVTDIECYGNTLLSKGENIRLIMERNNIQNAIYVGDTQGDCDAATYAGLPFVYVTYGFGKAEGVWKTIDDIREVLKLI